MEVYKQLKGHVITASISHSMQVNTLISINSSLRFINFWDNFHTEVEILVNTIECVTIAMHCNLKPPTPRQSLSVLITTPITKFKSINLSVAVL